MFFTNEFLPRKCAISLLIPIGGKYNYIDAWFLGIHVKQKCGVHFLQKITIIQNIEKFFLYLYFLLSQKLPKGWTFLQVPNLFLYKGIGK